MTLADDIATAAAKTGKDAQAAADRVTADLGTARTNLADAQQALADYIAAHPDDTAQLTDALASVNSADDLIASIDPAP